MTRTLARAGRRGSTGKVGPRTSFGGAAIAAALLSAAANAFAADCALQPIGPGEWRIGSTVEIVTDGMAVDADGAPDSYRVDGRGLSNTCDGVVAIVGGVRQTQRINPAHWYALCRRAWERAQQTGDYSNLAVFGFRMGPKGPIVQGAGDPLPRLAYVTTTSLRLRVGGPNEQRHYVDARQIPYVVLSPALAKTAGATEGDVVAVYSARTDAVAFAVWGDCCTAGEGSVRLHQDLGAQPIVKNSDGVMRASAGLSGRVVFFVFGGAHTHPTPDAPAWRSEIAAAGRAALAHFGGEPRLRACAGSKALG